MILGGSRKSCRKVPASSLQDIRAAILQDFMGYRITGLPVAKKPLTAWWPPVALSGFSSLLVFSIQS